MKEELKDLVVSLGLLIIGVYTRTLFGSKKYSIKQISAFIFFGVGIVYIMHLSKLGEIYKTSISLVAGLVMPNIINAIIKAANKSEDKAADKMSDKIDKLM